MSMTFNVGMMTYMPDPIADQIVALGEKNDKVVVVDSDIALVCHSYKFPGKYPDRAFDVGIAEQNMVAFAAGLAHEGYMPYCFTYAPFVSMRACEQVRSDVAYGNLNVRLFGLHAGYSGGDAGATHCGLEDASIMCGMPNMTVIEAGDPVQFIKLIDASLTWDGPIYFRYGGMAQVPYYPQDAVFEIGKATIPRDGADGAFITTGILVQHALEAANRIKEETGAEIRVVDLHTLKPIDREAIISAAKTGRIVVAQDHNIIGGLGYTVAAILAEEGIQTKIKMLGAPDKFVPLATPQYLFAVNEYDTEGLVKNMKALL